MAKERPWSSVLGCFGQIWVRPHLKLQNEFSDEGTQSDLIGQLLATGLCVTLKKIAH